MAGKGGLRSTSFKPTWKVGKTRLVRLPEVWVDDYIADAQVRDEGRDPDKEKMLFMIDKFIESQRAHAGGNQHKPAGELRIETSVHWRKLNEFKRWIEGE